MSHAPDEPATAGQHVALRHLGVPRVARRRSLSFGAAAALIARAMSWRPLPRPFDDEAQR